MVANLNNLDSNAVFLRFNRIREEMKFKTAGFYAFLRSA